MAARKAPKARGRGAKAVIESGQEEPTGGGAAEDTLKSGVAADVFVFDPEFLDAIDEFSDHIEARVDHWNSVLDRVEADLNARLPRTTKAA